MNEAADVDPVSVEMHEWGSHYKQWDRMRIEVGF